MRILVLCDEGSNRSVTIACRIKYMGHDVLTGGFNRNEPATMAMLCRWAQRIIVVERDMRDRVSHWHQAKVVIWDIGPDVYPRPFNKTLLRKVDTLIERHAHHLQETADARQDR